MDEHQRLRERIARYRAMMAATTDPRASDAMRDLCAEYEARLAQAPGDDAGEGGPSDG